MGKDAHTTKKQSGFHLGWKPISSKPTITSDGFKTMRGWQERAYSELKDKSRIILNAPMGSGKSLMMCFLSAYKMQKDKSLRCIITVPQTIIASGFTEAPIQFPDGSRLRWLAQHDLCSEQPSEGTINYVLNWLERPHVTLADRVLLCSHATIVAAYKELKNECELHLLKDLLVWIDEAHHIKNATTEDLDVVVSNGIGEFVNHLAENKLDNVHVGLATASFFRGDRCTLLSEQTEKSFVRFNLPYDEYFTSLKYLKSFSFDFLLCGPDYVKSIEEVLKIRKGKDIVYIPHPTSKHSTGDKYREVEDILSKYKKIHGGRQLDVESGLTIMHRRDGEFKILDLVDEDRRSQKKSLFMSAKQRDDMDAVIALGMCKEGADWIWADRSIIVGARASLVDVLQMIGRLFRDAEGKEHVEVIQLLPFSMDQVKEDDFKKNLNDYLKAIYASLLLENVFKPVTIKSPKREKKARGFVDKAQNALANAIPDETARLSLLEDMRDKLLDIKSRDEDANLWEEYVKFAPVLLEEYGVVDQAEEVAEEIWAIFTRRTMQMEGIDVSDIPFEILKDKDPLGFLIRYTSGACGVKTFKELRTVIGKRFKTIEEHVADAERLAEENGGILPHYKWMKSNGYGGLMQAMWREPEKFAHIQKHKFFNSVEEHVADAERLAKENGGILPNSKWLTDNGYNGLHSSSRKYSDRFAHIQQHRMKKSVEEHVTDAERLAKENGGILPNSKWLTDNGCNPLCQAILRRPDRFAHIEQHKLVKSIEEHVTDAERLAEDNGGVLPNPKCLSAALAKAMSDYPDRFIHIQKHKFFKSIEEHVTDAERLAKENGGALPHYKWMKSNGYGGLTHAVYNYPDRFIHIQKHKFFKSIEEHVTDAERLAKENGGILPNSKWLTDNGYNGLCQAMYRLPDRFAHIEQHKLVKSVEEHVTDAERLAKENGGILPNSKWLTDNGYHGIDQSTRKYPDRFAHIEQHKLVKSIEEHVANAEQLAEDNGGALPHPKWLEKNGYNGLCQAMYRRPDKFSHIKQKKFK